MEESQLYLCHLSSFIIQAIRNILSLLLFFIMSAPLHKICVEIILQIFKASPSVSSFVGPPNNPLNVLQTIQGDPLHFLKILFS